jgi:capsular polysaccharide biosynthesis protein
MTPIYQATTVLVPTAENNSNLQSVLSQSLGSLGGVAAVFGVGTSRSSLKTVEALAILRSREFTEAFIHDEQLMPVFFSDLWNAEEHSWVGEEEDWPTLAQAYKYFDSTVRFVSLDSQTGLVNVAIEWTDPETCARWANQLVERLNDVMRTRAIEQATNSIEFLERELLGTTTVEIRVSINRLIESQVNERMLANVVPEYSFRVVDRALPPDPGDPVRPNKPFIVLVGLLLGVMIGVTIALVRGASLVPSSSEIAMGETQS